MIAHPSQHPLRTGFGRGPRLAGVLLGAALIVVTGRAVMVEPPADESLPSPPRLWLDHECHLFGYAFGEDGGSQTRLEGLCQELYEKTVESSDLLPPGGATGPAAAADGCPRLRESPSRDGWGFAYFLAPPHPGLERPIFLKSGAAASDDDLRWNAAVSEIAAFGLGARSVVIGHVRKSSYGPDNGALVNPHPFADTLGGRWWTFAHNGHMVPDTLLAWIPPEFLTRHPLNYAPIEVDSEVLFRYCLYEIEQHGDVRNGLLAAFGRVREHYSAFVFNICMTDGDTLWTAHTHNVFPFYYGANEDSSAWWASTASTEPNPAEMQQHHLYWFCADGWGEASYE